MKGSNYCTHNYYMTHKEIDVISKNITIQFDAFILSLIVIHCSYVNFMNNTKIWFAIFKLIASHSLLQFDNVLAYDKSYIAEIEYTISRRERISAPERRQSTLKIRGNVFGYDNHFWGRTSESEYNGLLSSNFKTSRLKLPFIRDTLKVHCKKYI